MNELPFTSWHKFFICIFSKFSYRKYWSHFYFFIYKYGLNTRWVIIVFSPKTYWAKKIYGEIKKLGEKLVKNDWRNPLLGAPAQANAYFGSQENVIVLYAGLLQVTLILLSLVFPAESFLNLSKSESLWMMGSKSVTLTCQLPSTVFKLNWSI